MVCYLKDFGNEKPPLGRFVIFLFYPCVYREHITGIGYGVYEHGLSLCVQGTCRRVCFQCTLNAVYPCVYREHDIKVFKKTNVAGLSLCVQGTYQL